MTARLHLDDPLIVRGPAVYTTWAGALEGTLTPELHIDGALRTEGENNFEILGNRFQVESGSVTMAPESGVEPFIDIVANTQVEAANITATIRGRVSRPELTLTSDVTNSERDIFAMLVTGTSNLNDVDTKGAVSHAAASLGSLTNTAAKQERVERMGLDRMRVSYGKTLAEPIVSLGKNITPKLYTESTIRQNADVDENSIEGLLRYRMTPQWVMEAFFGDAAIGGVGVWWIKNFHHLFRSSTRSPAPSTPPAAPDKSPSYTAPATETDRNGQSATNER